VALVNQQPISRLDFLALLQTLYGVDLAHANDVQRRTALDSMIREELFVQRGKELGLAASDPDVRAALVNAVEAEIAQDAITSQPSEAALRDYFAGHAARYSSEGVMSVRDVRFGPNDRAAAERAAALFRTEPPTPASVDALHGQMSGAVGDDEFYFAAEIHLGARLYAVAKSLADGGVSPVVDSPDGFHVLYMIRNRRPAPFTFAEARDRILRDYREAAIARLRAGDESFLRKRANILIAVDLR